MSTTYQTKQRTLSRQSCINVPNQLNQKRLSDRVYEIYCILSTFAWFNVTTKTNYSVIKKFYEDKTKLSIHIDTIKSYINQLEDKNLLIVEFIPNRSGKFYLHLGLNIKSIDFKTGNNTYEQAKVQFTPFYIRNYETKGLLKGSLGLEMYMSSFPTGWNYRRKNIMESLDICERTYDTKKKNLQDVGIILMTKTQIGRGFKNSRYFYNFPVKNLCREETRKELEALREVKALEYEAIRQRRAEKKFNGYTKHYYVGELGAIVKKYKLSMNNITKNLDPTLALEFAKLTINQYKDKANAQLIMDSWKKQYNSQKVFDNRHQAFKEGLRQENIAIKIDNKLNGVQNGGVMGMSQILNSNNKTRHQITDDSSDTSDKSITSLLLGDLSSNFTNLVNLPTQIKRQPIQAKSEGHRKSLNNVERLIELDYLKVIRVIKLSGKTTDNPLTEELSHALSLVNSKDDFVDLYHNVYLNSSSIKVDNNKSLHRQVFTRLMNVLGLSPDMLKTANDYLDRHRYLE